MHVIERSVRSAYSVAKIPVDAFCAGIEYCDNRATMSQKRGHKARFVLWKIPVIIGLGIFGFVFTQLILPFFVRGIYD